MKTNEQLESENRMLNLQINNAIDEIRRLTDKNKELMNTIADNNMRAKSFMNNKISADNIFQDQLTKYNAENQKLLEKIDLLTNKLREYGYIGELVN